MRVPLAPQNQIITTLQGVFKDIEQIKNRQSLGGDIITPVVLETDNTYDYSSNFDGFNHYIELHIKFTANTQTDPYMFPVLQFLDTSNNSLSPALFSNYSISPIGGVIYFLGHSFGNFGDKIFYNHITAQRSSAAFRVKLLIFTSDRGVYDAEQT